MKKKGKSRFIKVLLFTFILLFLIVGVPFIINESYKADKGYITLWGASEVLSYYGTILGAVATILAVIYTIKFTRKQIDYEYTISKEKLKWEKVDNLLQEHFKKIMPTEIIKIYSSSEKANNPVYYIEKIQVRIIEIKTSLDWIKSYINPDEYKLISDYIEMLLSVDEAICNVCSRVVESLVQLNKNNLDIKAQQDINNQNIPLSTEKLKMHREKILDYFSVCSKELLDIQEKKFQNLLDCKRDIFYKIYSDLNRNEQKKLGKII